MKTVVVATAPTYPHNFLLADPYAKTKNSEPEPKKMVETIMSRLMGQKEPNCPKIKVVIRNTIAAETVSDAVRARTALDLKLLEV